MNNYLNASALNSLSNDIDVLPNLIRHYLSDNIIKALFKLCLRYDIPDNNTKAEIVTKLLGPEFEEVGTGTNRIAFRYHGFVIKIALDRRGLVDNAQEFYRSRELPQFLAKTYETNYLINLCEYVEVMDQSDFIANQYGILEMLKKMSEGYLFDDVGYSLKNSYNWGRRAAQLTPEEREHYSEEDLKYLYDICILDYGYLYKLYGKPEDVLRCPKCKHRLKWNSNYTGLGCTNVECNLQISPTAFRKTMDLSLEEIENRIVANLNKVEMPNLTTIEQSITKINKNNEEEEGMSEE